MPDATHPLPTPTSEPEVTSVVDLCESDGRTLRPSARGWSRTPMHRCNLRGRWGRTKRWDYWAVLTDDLVLSCTYADVDYIGIAAVWWCDLRTGESGAKDVIVPAARGFSLPDRPGTAPLRHHGQGLDLELVDDAEGTRLAASWTAKDGTPTAFDVHVALPPDHESLNVVIPWSDTLFQYTSKHQARPAVGTFTMGDRVEQVGGDAGQAWGVLDVGRGRWPYSTRWNWGGGAGRTVDGSSTVGIQIGGMWTEGTGFTENGVIVDGRLTKVGAELRWDYSWDEPMRPWRVVDPDGHLDLELTPRYDKHTGTNALVLRTEVHQVFGTWAGTVTTADGTTHEVDGIPGFAEESRSRW